MKTVYLAIALFCAQNFAADLEGSEWNGWNNPFKINKNFESNFDRLPKEGNIEKEGLAWPGYYWANNRGGIAHRWRAKSPNDFEYRSPGHRQVGGMSKKELDELSPAEKYDLFMGRYDYPTVATVWGQTREGHKDWYGICHGVSPSSLNHPEPKTKTVANKDGIEITFYSSDVKALLAYFYAKVSDSKSVQVGKRCFVAGWIPLVRRWSGCGDVNPASLHIIMANQLGLSKTGFIADMERFAPVWNHAAVRYTSEVVQKNHNVHGATTGAAERVKIRSRVSYSASVEASDHPILGTDKAKYEERIYVYWLDLDATGEIIGGEWVSKDRPDFLWVKERDEFDGYWKGLTKIYEPDL